MHKRGLLERTLKQIGRRREATNSTVGLSPQAFRAVMDERLRSLERQLDEVKSRVNGLIFLLAGTVAAQLLLGLVG